MSLRCSTRRQPLLIAVAAALTGFGCRGRLEPAQEQRPAPSTVGSNSANQAASSGKEQFDQLQKRLSSTYGLGSGAPPKAHAGDPLNGRFTLEEATEGLPPEGQLVAELATDAGKLRCKLFEDKAPKTVANFVGLARGLRPFKEPRTPNWVKRPAYDGTVFHRIIKGFMIQGGDPTGTGAGDPGYAFGDEVWAGAKHDRRGLLCMANRGPHTNGMQFFILDGASPQLDSSFTIFGSCAPDAVIRKLASSEVKEGRVLKPPKITSVTILRVK